MALSENEKLVLIGIVERPDSAQARLDLVCFMAGQAALRMMRGGEYGVMGSINFTALQNVCVDDWGLIQKSARSFFGV